VAPSKLFFGFVDRSKQHTRRLSIAGPQPFSVLRVESDSPYLRATPVTPGRAATRHGLEVVLTPGPHAEAVYEGALGVVTDLGASRALRIGYYAHAQ